jgi:magnesium chelatase accessory protein
LSRFVDAAGLRWHVQQLGTGPGLLLLHGTGASCHSFRDLMEPLARRFTVTAVDLPGQGFTAAAAAAHSSIAGMSRALGGLLQVLQFRPAYCAGHSAGAVVLCRMALDARIEPRAIISLNGAFMPFAGIASRLFPSIARLMAGTGLAAHLISVRARDPSIVARLIAGTGSALDPAGIDLYARLMRNPRHVAGALRMMGNWDLEELHRALPRLTVPLILMVGEEDRLVPPAQALALQRRLPRAVVRSMGRLGHLAHEEQPARIAEELLQICAAYPGGHPREVRAGDTHRGGNLPQ